MMKTCMAAAAAVLCGASAAGAQVSEYIVTAGGQKKISVLRDHAIQLQWSMVEEEVHPIAIPPFGGEVRTTGYLPATPGRTYDYDGNVIGGVLRHNIPGRCYDSASDGIRNYLVDYDSAKVYATDLDFKNEVLLFSLDPQVEWLGIAYDGQEHTLWLSAWNEEFVANFALDGTFIDAFPTGHVGNTALAFDPADRTLWLCDYTSRAFEQWHPSGIRLFSDFIPGMDTLFVNGGEFAPCYPDCDGSGGIDLFDFLCFTNAFNGEELRADCDFNGVYDLFDFLCFTNAFNEGC
jgi:hypothetical protein